MWWRLALLLIAAAQARGPLREIGWGLFGGITFGAHEFGHLFFALFGNEFLTVAGGSLMQLLVPIGAGVLMWRARDGVGVAIAGLWLAAAIGDLSWYVGDARALELPLVSMGGEGDDHDWNYLLRTFDLLRSDVVIAAQLRRVGQLIWVGSVVGGLVACWRRWQAGRVPRAIASILFLCGLSAVSLPTPLRAQRPAERPPRLLLIPLDDRPSSLDFPIRLGAIAGAEVVTPPRPLLGRFTQPADADAVVAWMRVTVRPPMDAVIVSIDLLAYGGLVASRTLASATADQAIARLAILREIRRRYPALPIYASASLMRLAPTADGTNEAYREALARWAEILPDTVRPQVAEEVRRLEARIPAAIRAAYLEARARNLRVHAAAVALVEAGVLTHLVFTQDDARTQGLHRAERDSLGVAILARGLGDRISLQSGTDEFGVLLVARALTARYGSGPAVAVTYVAPGDSARVMPFEDRPLAETVRAHLRLAGATITTDETTAALHLIVHTDRRTTAPDPMVVSPPGETSSARAARLVRESRRPVILADIDPTGSIQGADTSLTDALTASGRFPTLAGYGAWNTAGNAVGTAVAQGVVRWLAMRDSLDESLTGRRAAHAAFLLDRWLDDDLYKSRLRPALIASIRARGWDPFRMTEGQTGVIEGELRAAVGQRLLRHPDLASVLGPRCTLASPIGVRLPWGRTFEAAFDFKLRC